MGQRLGRCAIAAAALAVTVGCGNGDNGYHRETLPADPCARSTGTVVTMGRPGDRWLDTMQFKVVARAKRDGRYGYEVSYELPGSGALFTLFWSRDQIDLQGTSPGSRLASKRLNDGRLYYPSRITAASLPNVYNAIQLIEQGYADDARGMIAAAEAFAIIASLGGPPKLGPRAPPPRPGLPAARVVGTKFKPFTQKYFRENLRRLTGHMPKGAHAHHVLPKEFAKEFRRAGINIHDPHYGAWWQASAHLSAAKAYNARWRNFFELDNTPSVEKILDFARETAKEYGLKIYF